MENSDKQNVNLVVNKLGKNIKKNHLQHTIHVRNNIITRNRYSYPHREEFYNVHKDQFKDFVQQITTGTKTNQVRVPSWAPISRVLQKNRPPSLSIVRPRVPVQVPAWVPIAPPLASKDALPTHPLQPNSEPSFVENSQSSVVESPISASMRNFEDSMMEFGNSSGNQINPLACQTQVVNNIEPSKFSSSLFTGPRKNRPSSLSIVRSRVAVQVPAWAPIAPPLASKNALPTHPLQPNSKPSFVENLQTSVVESPISASMRNFEDSVMEFGNSSSNQLNPLACQTQVVNNIEPSKVSSSLFTGPRKNRPPSLSIVRPRVAVQVPAWAPIAPPLASKDALPTPPLQPNSEPSFVDNSQTSVVESPISASMRNFEDSVMEFGNSSGNQLNPLACQTQVVNNIEPSKLSSSLFTGPMLPMLSTNQTLPMNNGNQFVNDFPSPQTNGPQSPTSEFPIPWPTSNMNLVSPQSPYSPLLPPSLFSSPPSPDFPFHPYLQNNGISSSYPQSPFSAEICPF